MAKIIADEIKQEAIRLRVEERLGLKAICRKTGLSLGMASMLLRDHRLSQEEVRERRSHAAVATNKAKGRYDAQLSRWALLLSGQQLSRDEKGQIAEAAVLFRLAIHHFQTWRASSDGNRVDWLVTRYGTRRHIRLQVKWAARDKRGRPCVRPMRRSGKTLVPLTQADCDFVVGYDLETDIAFVMPIAHVVCRRRSITCGAQYAEAWEMLGI
jgi:hypothetical protein